MPISDARMTTLNPTRSETRAPKRMRESTSRPRSSRPSRCSCDGGFEPADRVLRIRIERRQQRRRDRDEHQRDRQQQPAVKAKLRGALHCVSERSE